MAVALGPASFCFPAAGYDDSQGLDRRANSHRAEFSFHEDASRIGSRNGAANFALFRKLALNLLKRNPREESIARKRKRAALDTAFLAETLLGANKVEE